MTRSDDDDDDDDIDNDDDDIDDDDDDDDVDDDDKYLHSLSILCPLWIFVLNTGCMRSTFLRNIW